MMPRDRVPSPSRCAAGAGGVEPQIIENIVEPQHLLWLADAEVGAKFTNGYVLWAVTFIVLVEDTVRY